MSKERLEKMIRDGATLKQAASICGIALDRAKALVGDKVERVALPADETDVKELARLATPAAMRALVEIASDPDASASARVAASAAIMDRAHGKPAQSIEHSGGVMVTLQSTVRDALIQANKILEADFTETYPQAPQGRGSSSYILDHPLPAMSTDL